MAEWDKVADVDIDVGDINIQSVNVKEGIAYMSGQNIETGKSIAMIGNAPDGVDLSARNIDGTTIRGIMDNGHESIEFHSNYNNSNVVDSINENINNGYNPTRSMNVALAEQHGIPRVEAHQIADAHTTKDFRGKLDTIFPDGPADDAIKQMKSSLSSVTHQFGEAAKVVQDNDLVQKVMRKIPGVGAATALFAATEIASASEAEAEVLVIEAIPFVGAVAGEMIRTTNPEVESGLVRDGIDFIESQTLSAMTHKEVEIHQNELLQDPDLGLPSEINGIPFTEAMRDDATRESFTDILDANENENTIDAINRFVELEPTRLEKVMEEVQAMELEVSAQEPDAPQNNSSGLAPA